MKHKYFISFVFDVDGNMGHGNMETEVDKPITSIDDIVAIGESVKQRQAFDNIVIMNYREMD